MKLITSTLAVLVTAAVLLFIPLTTFAADPPFSSVGAAVQGNGNQTIAQAVNGQNGFANFIGVIKNAINIILPVIISLAVLFFIWGVFLYVRSNDPGKQEEAKMYIIWSLIFIAVMVSVWGLVNILTSSFNLDKTAPPPPPIPEYAS